AAVTRPGLVPGCASDLSGQQRPLSHRDRDLVLCPTARGYRVKERSMEAVERVTDKVCIRQSPRVVGHRVPPELPREPAVTSCGAGRTTGSCISDTGAPPHGAGSTCGRSAGTSASEARPVPCARSLSSGARFWGKESLDVSSRGVV